MPTCFPERLYRFRHPLIVYNSALTVSGFLIYNNLCQLLSGNKNISFELTWFWLRRTLTFSHILHFVNCLIFFLWWGVHEDEVDTGGCPSVSLPKEKKSTIKIKHFSLIHVVHISSQLLAGLLILNLGLFHYFKGFILRVSLSSSLSHRIL